MYALRLTFYISQFTSIHRVYVVKKLIMQLNMDDFVLILDPIGVI